MPVTGYTAHPYYTFSFYVIIFCIHIIKIHDVYDHTTNVKELLFILIPYVVDVKTKGDFKLRSYFWIPGRLMKGGRVKKCCNGFNADFSAHATEITYVQFKTFALKCLRSF